MGSILDDLLFFLSRPGYEQLAEIEDRLVTTCTINDMSWRTPYPDDDEPYYIVQDLPGGLSLGHGSWGETLPIVRSHFESRVRTIFELWRDLPDPASAGGVVKDLTTAMGTLNAGEVDGLGGLQGPLAVGQQIIDLENKILHFTGDTMTAFRGQVVGQLQRVANNQALLTAFLGKCIAGEAKLWTEARERVGELGMAAIAAASRAGREDSQDGASVGQGLSVLGTILVGAAAFGPQAIALTVVGTGLLVTGTLWEDDASGPPASDPHHLAGKRPDEVLDNLTKALTTLKESIYDEEALLDRRLSHALNVTGSDRHVYDLRPARFLWSKTSPDYLDENNPEASGAEESFVVPSVLHQVANQEMSRIATSFGDAAKRIEPNAFRTLFQRPEGLGWSIIDLGSTYEWVAGNIQFAMQSTEADVESCAEHLRIAANIHGHNDEQVRQDLENHRANVEKDRYITGP